MRLCILSLICIIYIGIVRLDAQNLNELEGKIDQIFSDWKIDGPGGVIGVVKDGSLIFEKSFGLASLEFQVPNTTGTLFNIASVSKQITAFSLVLLEQEGKIDLDDDIRKYLPEVPAFDSTITIRHLLTHTSGLRNFQNLLSMAGWREGDSMTNDDLLRFISRQKELNYPVGAEYLYCNTGFVLATFIVERVTGMDFKDWTTKNIFEPLEMHHSGFREDMTEVHTNTATSYDRKKDGFIQPLKYWTYMGNGNVYTTISDLSRWIGNLESGILGGKDAIETLTTRGILNNGDTLNYALGIGVGNYHGHRRWYHSGSVGGYRSALYYFPDDHLGVIAVSNFSTANPGTKVGELADYLLDIETETDVNEAGYQHPVNVVESSMANFERYAGSYYVQGAVVDAYVREGNRYMIAREATPEFLVLPASDSIYFVPVAGISVFFEKGGEKIKILQGDQLMDGYRILKESVGLSQFEGTYYSPELDTEYIISLDGNNLIGYHQRHGRFELYPISRDEIKGGQFYFADIEVERWSNGDVMGLRVSNGRVRNLWFRKME